MSFSPKLSTQDAMALAIRHHQAGRLAEAEALYREVLVAQPNHADALHLLGVLAAQAGRPDVAVPLIRRAILLDSGNPVAFSNLGEALHTTGQLAEAVESFRRAIALKPDFSSAYNNLAVVLGRQGKANEALACCRRALEIDPRSSEAHTNLSHCLLAEGRLDEAIAAGRQAVQIDPRSAEAHNNLGVALARQGRFSEAEPVFRRALDLRPSYAEALNNLANTLSQLCRADEAIEMCTRALRLRPDYAEAWNNLGTALWDLNRLEEAATAAGRALDVEPTFAAAHQNLGQILRDQGRLAEAAASYERALRIQPGHAAFLYSYSLLLLLQGDWKQAWPMYEARWKAGIGVDRHFSQPLWDGSRLDGKRLLLHAEEGLGDAIQFIRYLPLVAAAGGEAIVECAASCLELFRTAKSAGQIVARGEPLPRFDVHLPMLRLPFVFQTTPETIPGEAPFLFADDARRARWRERLGENRSRLRVGLAWRGNTTTATLRKRHVSLDTLRPLLEVESVDFVSLQIHLHVEEREELTDSIRILDLTHELHSFADTAALIAELDLVISVDAAVAHLAGALGRPAWTMLMFVPDWRWGLETAQTLWYPGMRLFRQPAVGDWESVVREVAEELRRYAGHAQ